MQSAFQSELLDALESEVLPSLLAKATAMSLLYKTMQKRAVSPPPARPSPPSRARGCLARTAGAQPLSEWRQLRLPPSLRPSPLLAVCPGDHQRRSRSAVRP